MRRVGRSRCRCRADGSRRSETCARRSTSPDRRDRSSGREARPSTACRSAPACRARRCQAPEVRDCRRSRRRGRRPDRHSCPARCSGRPRQHRGRHRHRRLAARGTASPRAAAASARPSAPYVSGRAAISVVRLIDDAGARREMLLHRLAGLGVGADDLAAVGRADPDALAVVARCRSARCLPAPARGRSLPSKLDRYTLQRPGVSPRLPAMSIVQMPSSVTLHAVARQAGRLEQNLDLRRPRFVGRASAWAGSRPARPPAPAAPFCAEQLVRPARSSCRPPSAPPHSGSLCASCVLFS